MSESDGREWVGSHFEQMLYNKEHGSIAKYWRQRYMDADQGNATDELRQIKDAMWAEAIDVLPEPDAENASPTLVFKDRSGFQFRRRDDGGWTALCINAVSTDITRNNPEELG